MERVPFDFPSFHLLFFSKIDAYSTSAKLILTAGVFVQRESSALGGKLF